MSGRHLVPSATRTRGGRRVNHALCACGCGRTPVAGRYLKGHNRKALGGKTRSHGYVLVMAKDHPRANPRGYVREHILVAERTLGRRVGRNEDVHHINGDRADNRPENLEVLSHREHMARHADAATMRERGRRGNAARYGWCEDEAAALSSPSRKSRRKKQVSNA